MSNFTEITVVRQPVEQAGSLDDFLAAIERRALRMAQVAIGDRDAALDIVQDSMMKLVQHYEDRSPSDWRPLFYRILNNGITDWHRSQSARWKVFDRWFGSQLEDDTVDHMDQVPGAIMDEPDQQLLSRCTLMNIEQVMRTLSNRQQQAFMLRCWEGMNTAETASIMACSEGTVKTLYSRALANLRTRLQATPGESHE